MTTRNTTKVAARSASGWVRSSEPMLGLVVTGTPLSPEVRLVHS